MRLLAVFMVAFSLAVTASVHGGDTDAVFDLSGEWEAIVTVRGLGSGTETVEHDVVRISQKQNEFLGVRTVGCSHIAKNGEWIKGKLANGLVVEMFIQVTDDPVTFTTKWNDGRAALAADANQLVAQTFNAAGNYLISATLTRR